MMQNRSVPADILLPHIVYRDVAEAIAWLTRVFGFTEHYRYGDPPQGAQLRLGDAWIMLSSARPGRTTPSQSGSWTQSVTLFVNDVDAHYEKTKSAGAKIVEDLHETIYGERQYVVEDLDGHPWLFSTHARDIAPEDWGAVLAGNEGSGF
jgi:uncharacterized glyoxalase superfamily protein PhnB